MSEEFSVKCIGGMDLVTPAIEKQPGSLIACVNHEARPQGYARVAGWERVDGRPEPHKQTYWVLNFDAGSVAVSEGDEVIGLTSQATALALVDAVVTSGSYGAGTAAGYLVLTQLDDVFEDNEPLQVSFSTVSTGDGVAERRGATNDTDDKTWQRDAIATARLPISALPGSGPTLGAISYLGDRYGFRDTEDALTCKMFRGSHTGWVEMDLGRVVDFTSGSEEILELDQVTGATSSATAEVRRIIKTSGSYSDGDAAGYIVLYGQLGTFQAEDLNIASGSSNVATIAADSTENVMPAGGLFTFRVHNFFGSTNGKRLYAAYGTGQAFEWDGDTFTPIVTGMTEDRPSRVSVFKEHLFLAFPGGSIQHSGTTTPYSFDPVLGAAEIGLGDEVTNFLDDYAGTLVVTGRNKTAILFGTSIDDWEFVKYPNDAGADPFTGQMLARPIYMDTQGVRELSSVRSYGDFEAATLSALTIKPFLESKKKGEVQTVCSVRVKSKNQYRCFYEDASVMVMDASGKKPSFSTMQLGFIVRCATSEEDVDGSEVVLLGDDDGFVYRAEAGTSADGAAIEATLRFAFNHVGSPGMIKIFSWLYAEIEAEPDTDIYMTADFSYGNTDQPGVGEISFDLEGGGGFWDAANWDEFNWDTQVVGTAVSRTPGRGTNISLGIGSELIHSEPYIISGFTQYYNMRRKVRGGR